jgi:hypothetical protein
LNGAQGACLCVCLVREFVAMGIDEGCALQALVMTQSPHENPEVLIQMEATAGLT